MNNLHIIENHDMALEVWRNHGVFNSILMHVDAHFDYVSLKDSYYVNIGNYLVYALSEKRFKKIYWVVPDVFWKDSTYAEKIINQLPQCFKTIDVSEQTIKLKTLNSLTMISQLLESVMRFGR